MRKLYTNLLVGLMILQLVNCNLSIQNPSTSIESRLLIVELRLSSYELLLSQLMTRNVENGSNKVGTESSSQQISSRIDSLEKTVTEVKQELETVKSDCKSDSSRHEKNEAEIQSLLSMQNETDSKIQSLNQTLTVFNSSCCDLGSSNSGKNELLPSSESEESSVHEDVENIKDKDDTQESKNDEIEDRGPFIWYDEDDSASNQADTEYFKVNNEGKVANENIEESPESLDDISICRAHSQPITSAVLSPNEKYLVSRSSKGEIKIWNLWNKGSPVRTIDYPDSKEYKHNSMVVSGEGNLNVVVNYKNETSAVLVYDMNEFKEIKTLVSYSDQEIKVIGASQNNELIVHTKSTVSFLDFESGDMIKYFNVSKHLSIILANDTSLYGVNGSSILVYDVRNGSLLGTWKNHRQVNQIVVDPTTGFLVSCFDYHSIKIWDREHMEQADIIDYKGWRNSQFDTIVFDKLTGLLLGSNYRHELIRLDLSTGSVVQEIDFREHINRMIITKRKQLITFTTRGFIRVNSIDTLSEPRSLFDLDLPTEESSTSSIINKTVCDAHFRGVKSLTTSKDGKYLFSISGKDAKLWDLKSGGRIVKTFSSYVGFESSIAFPGQIAYSDHGTLAIVNLSTLNVKEKELPIYGMRLAWNPSNANQMAIGGYHRDRGHDVILIFDIDKMSTLKTLDYTYNSFNVKHLVFDNDGYLFCYIGGWSNNKKLDKWDLKASRIVSSVSITLDHLKYDQKSESLITAGEDDIKIWDSRTMEVVKTLSLSDHGKVQLIEIREGTGLMHSKHDFDGNSYLCTWNLITKELVKKQPVEPEISSMAAFGNNSVALGFKYGSIKYIDF